MSVLRVRKNEPQKISLIRANMVYPPVSAKMVTDPGPDPVGVIQTYSLAKGRVAEIAAKVQDLQKQGAKRFVAGSADVRERQSGGGHRAGESVPR